MATHKGIEEFIMNSLIKSDSVTIYRHIPEVTAQASLSSCKKFRYRLTINNPALKKGKTVCVVMQNPSVANSDIADKSAQFLEKLIFLKDYSEFKDVKEIIIVNQFAYIQTKDFKGSDKNIGVDNDVHIAQAIKSSDIILIAWGVSNKYRKRQLTINSILNKFSNKVLLQTKKHPSRGTYKDFIKPYKS